MATREKFNYYSALSDSTLHDLTARRGDWQQFLNTAARLYKYSFQDQVMIYAQKPNAVACAEIPLWNEQFNRWVRKGTKGIALIDDSGSYPDLKYVFDVSDTEPSRFNDRPVQLWEMTAEHKPLVLAELAKNYEDIGDSLGESFRNIARELAVEYYKDNAREIMYQAENSVLEPTDAYDFSGLPIETADDFGLRTAFVNMLGDSVAYSIMVRCGLDTSEYFDDTDFGQILEFNTPMMANALGAATADLSEQVLRDIELIIRKQERVKNAQIERSENDYDRNFEADGRSNLQPSGRLSSPQHQAERTAEGTDPAARQVRENEESVPQRTPENNIQPPITHGATIPAPERSGRSGDGEARTGDEIPDRTEQFAGQSHRPNGVDSGDEHAESTSRGAGVERTDLQRNEHLTGLLSTSSITIDEVDSILRDGANSNSSVSRIAAHFTKGKDDNAEYLRREYLSGRWGHAENPSGKGFDFAGTSGASNRRVCAWFDENGINLAVGVTARNNIHKVTIPWDVAAERVNELMLSGQYISRDRFNEALDNGHDELAARLWDFYRDDMHDIPQEFQAGKGGYPEDKALIKSLLDNTDERQAILDRLEVDVAVWKENGERSWRNPNILLADMRDSMLPPVIFPDDSFNPTKNFTRYITQDEIDAYLTRGSNVSEGKMRIMSHFLGDYSDKERADFLKNEYGHGGGTWSEGNGWSNHEPGKGLTLQRDGTIFEPEAVVNLNWNNVAKLTQKLINNGRYMTRTELDRIPNYERLMLVRKVNNFYHNLPEEYEKPFADLDFYYPHEDEWAALRDFLDDTERVDGVLAQMSYIFENTSTDDRYYETRKAGFEALTAFRDGTYTLFPGVENLPDPDVAAHRLETPATPHREMVEDLRESPFGGFWDTTPGQSEQLNLFAFDAFPVLPSVEEQQTTIDETLKQEAKTVENRVNEPFLDISDTDKARIAAQFTTAPRSREAANLVKEIYGDTLGMPLPQVIKRITELVAEGKFTLETPKPELQLTAVGDFYEITGDNAQIAADVLRLTVTERNGEPMVGFPNRVLDDYLKRLTDAGYAVLVPETLKTAEQVKETYKAGDTLWLDGRKFIVDEISDFYKQPDDLDRKFGTFGYTVSLTDITGGYPIGRSLYSSEIDYKLELDERNAAFLSLGEITEQTVAEVEIEPEPIPEPMPPPEFDAVAQTVYDRVMANDDFANQLQSAQSRGSLRSPLNSALDKVIGELKEESDLYRDYFNDDITDDLFDHVYKTAWENRPQPETVQQPEQPQIEHTVAPLAERIYQENGTDYYLLQNPAILTLETLALITEKADKYVLSAETCHLADADMERLNITFRKMPRDFGLLPEAVQARITELEPQYQTQWQEQEETNSNPVMQQLLRYEIRPVTVVEQISSNPQVVSLLDKGDNGRRYGIWDNQKDNASDSKGGYLKHEDGTTVIFKTEEEAAAYIDRLNNAVYESVGWTPQIPDTPAVNFRITDDHLGEGGAKAKFHGNIDAIKTLHTLETERRNATSEEQETLSRYVGWGGLPQAFDADNASWAREYNGLRELELGNVITKQEYDAMRASTLNAHYTSPTVIKAMWETIGRLGFQSGNVLEPSVGVGNFFGLVPENLRNSKLYGVELDGITAKIAQRLYPSANIQQKGFEQTEFSDSFFDIAVGNVPFGSYGVLDKRYEKQDFSIHNYFFAKSLDLVRPGGVVAFVTSKFTMDEKNPKVRKYLAKRAELLGAVRLPNTAFLKNAGTETTMDILFLQKRDRPLDIEPDWVHLGLTDDGIPVNRYYLDNPEMICGTMALDEHMNNKYGRNDYTCCLPTESADLGEQLRTALSFVQGKIELEELEDLEGVDNHAIPADSHVKNFSYSLVDNIVYFRENSLMYPVDLPATTLERIKGMIGLRDCVGELISLQLDEHDDSEIKAQQAKLNTLHDRFTSEFRLINSTANNRAFNADSAYYLLSSLEIINEDGELERKADMFTKRTIKQKTIITHVDTASEALAVSLGERARVDMAYMSELTGKDEATLFSELRGVIFADFDMDVYSNNIKHCEISGYTYKTADEFLSGNVREKLSKYSDALEVLNTDSPHYEAIHDNAEALKLIQPKELEAGEIAVRLGATWIDPKYVQQFMYELLNTSYYSKNVYQVKYHEFTGEWQVTGKGKSQFSDIPSTVTYGTGRMNAYQIIDDTLNLRDVRVYDYKEDADGKERRVLNKKETMLAQQRQELIKQAFKDWIWKDPERRQSLTLLYNERFNSIRTREYDGSHITFGGISPEITLRQHQLNAIAHILYGGNTLLAHEVGAGKTFEMVGAAMEAKRLGLCHKSLFAVPNHLTEQWAGEFLRLYPSANILVATKKDFEMRNRKKFCAKIATGDYDAVIVGHSQLEKIPLSKERQERLFREQLDEIEDGIRDLKSSNGERFSIKQLEKTKRGIEVKLSKLLDAKKRDDVVTFEQLGVDRLYVDEAHGFKNLFLYTKMRNVAGLSTSDAAKSSDLFMKCRYLDELTDSKGVIFATGTPISNSMTELYTLQRYLQYDTLVSKNLTHFDAWASIFGEQTTSIELAPEGNGYRARTRFAKFHNLPELMTIFRDVADIQTADMLHLPVPDVKYENVIVEPSDLQKEMVEELSERAAKVHAREVDATVDNMLKITTDGRKIGLDSRLMNPLSEDFEGSKVNACTDNVFRIWDETKDDRLTQLLFCDFSTPNKDGRFNIYDDIKAKLIERGIPEHELAFIHDADTETRKKELFAKVRQGKIRVLFGSTFKMGSGTNVQDRLVAIHDADCPWRPADLAQRAGRIVRQGNKNAEVQIFRYATSGTFDSYLWQTVQKKQEFIAQIMSSKSPVRSCDDCDETALSYAEIKALCAGNPLIAEKMALDNEVAKLRMLKSEHRSQHYRLEDDLLKRFPEQTTSVTARIAGIEKDIAMYAISKEKCVDIQTIGGAANVSSKFPGMVVKGVNISEKEPAAKALIEACKDVKGRNVDMPIGEYMGFKLSLQYESFGQQINLHLRGAMTYKIELGTDALGNITRINNALDKLPERLAGAKENLANIEKQVTAAKEELTKPFTQDVELTAKEQRLALLNSDLNIDGDGDMDVMNDTENREESGQELSDSDERDDDDAEQNEPRRNSPYTLAQNPPTFNYGEQRTGTYDKAKPSILTDLEAMSKSLKPTLSGGNKSAEIDI